MSARRLIKALTEGMDVQKRSSGRVARVRANSQTVAEIVIGKDSVRVNFREAPPGSNGMLTGGRAAAWPGGGTRVTPENLPRVRELLERAIIAEQSKQVIGALTHVVEEGVIDNSFEAELAALLERHARLAAARPSRPDDDSNTRERLEIAEILRQNSRGGAGGRTGGQRRQRETSGR